MKIDDKTSVPLMMAISCIPFIVGGMVWLTNIDSKANQALAENAESKPILQKTYESVIRIEERLNKKK